MAGPGRPIQQGPRAFDDAKLQAMVEPLTVRCDRLKDHKRSPIPLWESDSGQPDGAGWTKEEVRRMETQLLTQWSGGGLYEVTVTDSGDPPVTMKWQPFWSTVEYPELVPPPLQDARSPNAPPAAFPTPLTPTAPQVNRMPPTFPQLAAAQHQVPYYAQPYQMPPPPAVGTPAWGHWRDEAERREKEAELKRLRDEKEQRDRDAAKAQYEAALERERTANNERFARMEAMFKEMMATPKGESPELAAMRQQMAAMQEQARRAEEKAERERADREAERRERELRDQMRAIQDATQRQMEAIQRQIEAQQQQTQQMITQLTNQIANAANKQDPLLMFMQEQARQQAETLKEIARSGKDQMTQLQAFMMNPREMVALARESQQGVEQAIDRTMKLTNSVIDAQNRVLENALQMQPGGGGVVDVVRDGVNGVKDFLQRYVVSKAKESQFAAQANVQIAQAQAHAIEAQARATNPAAFVPPPGLAGPTLAPQSVPTSEPEPEPTATPAPSSAPTRLWGRTDVEWFGPALPKVMEMRANVQAFHDACAQMDASGVSPDKIEDIPGMHPHAAANAIVIAANVIQEQGVPVAAMQELLAQGMLAEFMGVLLPDASPKYREDVITILTSPGNSDEDDEDEDDGDDQPQQVIDVKAVEAPKAQAQRNGRARAKA